MGCIQFIDSKITVCIDADLASGFQCLFNNRACRKFSISESERCGLRKWPSDPTAIIPFSGSMTSPLPVMIRDVSVSAPLGLPLVFAICGLVASLLPVPPPL